MTTDQPNVHDALHFLLSRNAWEQEAWGSPLRAKSQFALFANDHHGDGPHRTWCNAPVEGSISAAREPDKCFVPPYVA
jgi:hypothetical protein